MTDRDYIDDLAESAAKELFESQWSEGCHEFFESWQKDAVAQVFVTAFIEGAVFCANLSRTSLPRPGPQDSDE